MKFFMHFHLSPLLTVCKRLLSEEHGHLSRVALPREELHCLYCHPRWNACGGREARLCCTQRHHKTQPVQECTYVICSTSISVIHFVTFSFPCLSFLLQAVLDCHTLGQLWDNRISDRGGGMLWDFNNTLTFYPQALPPPLYRVSYRRWERGFDSPPPSNQ